MWEMEDDVVACVAGNADVSFQMLSMKVSGIKNRKTKFVEGQKLRNEKTKSKK